MSDNKHAELFAAWLDGTLSDQQRIDFERICSEDDEFAAQVEVANRVDMLAQDYRPVAVPKWNRESTFEYPKASKWWQWQGLPVLSLACSFVAILLVVSGFQLQAQDGVIRLSFNRGIDQSQVEQLVEARLAKMRLEQASLMESYAQTLQQQQLDASTQLTNYLLASSRQERREDFGEFIKFINEQRSEDQVFYARQLNQLQQQLYSNTIAPAWSADTANQIND